MPAALWKTTVKKNTMMNYNNQLKFTNDEFSNYNHNSALLTTVDLTKNSVMKHARQRLLL